MDKFTLKSENKIFTVKFKWDIYKKYFIKYIKYFFLILIWIEMNKKGLIEFYSLSIFAE